MRRIPLFGVCLFPTSSANYFDGVHRLLKHALELKKPVMLLNVGPSRADGLSNIEKIDMPSGAIITDVARAVMYVVRIIRGLLNLILLFFHIN